MTDTLTNKSMNKQARGFHSARDDMTTWTSAKSTHQLPLHNAFELMKARKPVSPLKNSWKVCWVLQSLSNVGGRCGCQALGPTAGWILSRVGSTILRGHRYMHLIVRLWLFVFRDYLLLSSTPCVVRCTSNAWRHPKTLRMRGKGCPLPT